MTYIEKKEEYLKSRIIEQNMEDDFADFWEREVAALRRIPLEVQRRKLNLPYKTFTAYEMTFNTHDDTIVTGYFCVPNIYEGKPLPCVAYYHGGGGRYGIAADIVATGVCTFSMDGRNQGGKTYDKAEYDVIVDYRGGVMSHGHLDKEGFYMKNLYLDAVRLTDVIASMPEVDENRIVSYGISQGGALSIVAAALSGRIKKAYPTVPSYSCIERRIELGSGVFEAVKYYLSRNPSDTDRVMRAVSYFDINNIVSLLDVPVDFFLGLGDSTCLPEFVYSPYANAKSKNKRIFISPFTPHDISTDYKEQIYREFSEL